MAEIERMEFKFAGAGGQGLITAGVLLAEAAILEGKKVVQAQSYGPEARLGSSTSDVIVDTKEIYHPKTSRPNAMLIMNQESFDKFASRVAEGGIIVVDTDFVPDPKGPANARLIPLNLTTRAKEDTGYPMTANILGLAIIVGLTKVVSPESVVQAVKNRFASKQRYLAPNLKALELGFKMAEEIG